MGLSDELARPDDGAAWVVPTDPPGDDEAEWGQDLGGPEPTTAP